MNVFRKCWCRIFQGVFWVAYHFIPLGQPKCASGKNALATVCDMLGFEKVKKTLIVTDSGIVKAGLVEKLCKVLDDGNIEYVVFDETVPNPTIDNIEKARSLYLESQCQAIVAIGGGSAIDCAKGVGARIARQNKPIPKMKGVLKVLKKLPPLIAIPTTAGTGSECTLACVVTNPLTHEKYALNDVNLVPKYAVLDPLLTVNLPKHITSTTGLDALTHAVEAFIGHSNTRKTRAHALLATQLIFENLEKAFDDGQNVLARENMLTASYFAGAAFTRAFVGYVHAIAHTLGGFYNMPHGLANAILLPKILRYYGKHVYKPLAKLADAVGILGNTKQEKAENFILAIEQMNKKMGIPDKIECIQEKDIPLMAKRASQEANPLYPVPKLLDEKELEHVYRELQNGNL